MPSPPRHRGGPAGSQIDPRHRKPLSPGRGDRGSRAPSGACAGLPGRPSGAPPPRRTSRLRAARRSTLLGPPRAPPMSHRAGCRPPGHRPADRARRRTARSRRSPNRAASRQRPSRACAARPRLIEKARTSTSTSPGAAIGSGTTCTAILPGAELSATSARMGRALRSCLPSSRRSYVPAPSAIR